MTPQRQKGDRDEVFLEDTKSICPVCKTVIDGEVNAKDNRVFLRKRCAEHGQFEALPYSDAEMFFDSLRFNKPGTIPLERSPPTRCTRPSTPRRRSAPASISSTASRCKMR